MAAQLAQNGTTHPPTTADHLKTSRERWPAAMSKKITLAKNENALEFIVFHLLMESRAHLWGL
jgi:hypothetical protein